MSRPLVAAPTRTSRGPPPRADRPLLTLPSWTQRRGPMQAGFGGGGPDSEGLFVGFDRGQCGRRVELRTRRGARSAEWRVGRRMDAGGAGASATTTGGDWRRLGRDWGAPRTALRPAGVPYSTWRRVAGGARRRADGGARFVKAFAAASPPSRLADDPAFPPRPGEIGHSGRPRDTDADPLARLLHGPAPGPPAPNAPAPGPVCLLCGPPPRAGRTFRRPRRPPEPPPTPPPRGAPLPRGLTAPWADRRSGAAEPSLRASDSPPWARRWRRDPRHGDSATEGLPFPCTGTGTGGSPTPQPGLCAPSRPKRRTSGPGRGGRESYLLLSDLSRNVWMARVDVVHLDRNPRPDLSRLVRLDAVDVPLDFLE